MMRLKLVTLIRECRFRSCEKVDHFWVDETIEDVEQALRQAVATYLQLPEAKSDIEYAEQEFSWEEVVGCVPEMILNQYGIYHGPTPCVVRVNQNEVLFPDLQRAHFTPQVESSSDED